MGDSATISYKVYFDDGSEVPEVRRFGVERINAFNFHHLRDKLQSVFPSLKNKSFNVYWKDAAGDNVVISSDEELTIALSEMNTDVRKLYVVKNAADLNFNSDFEMSDGFAKLGDGPAIHEGVTCDGCNKGIEGFRYKCIVCPDYDLCANCEGMGIHKEHFMIRIPKPVNWRPAFSRRLARNIANSVPHCDPNRYQRRTCGGRYSSASAQDEKAGQCPFRGGQSQHGSPGNWLEYLCNHLGEWANLAGEFDVPSASKGSSGSAKASSSGNNESAATSGTRGETTEKGAAPENQNDIEYLRKVGNTVAAFLNPLGIDIEIRSKEDTPTTSERGNDQGAKPKEKQSSPRNITPEQMEVTQDNLSSPPTDSQSPEQDGWTVLSQNPKVAETLRKLLSMGFTNDGGWLTQLITVKNGDLESVLDALQQAQK